MIGLFLGFIYLFLFYYFLYFDKNKIKFFIPIILLIIISVSLLLIIKYFIKEKDDAWYKVFNYGFGTVFNIGENLPLGFDIIYLIKHKISERNTLFGAFGGIVNTNIWLIWAIYKVVKEEENLHYSIVANSIAICLHILQFILFFVFRKKVIDEKEKIIKNKNNDENLITNSYEEERKEKSKKENEIIEDFM